MTKAIWIRIIASTLGVVAFGILVWFVGPLLTIADVRPLDSAWVRAAIILFVASVVAAVIGFQFYRRRKAAQELERGMAAAEEQDSDATVLRETMKDALATLRQAKGAKGNFVYDLPWYIIIGPPGSGKTTALINSGLKFPLSRGATPEAVAGVGGTRYCDWWFAEDAVLIDTAGRYTTHDSDAKADRTSWLTFLDLLKRNRPRQPINGVMVAISLEDLLTLSSEEIGAHATAIRKRLTELHERLNVDFPVYALFTKADLVAGFMEFFGGLMEPERRMVWGHTFQTSDKTRNMIGEVPAEYDALIERLNEQLPDRLQDEPTPAQRVQVFGFPSQMAALKKDVVGFLNRVFEPTRYHANATLRGFYFTSGTQQGTPIDQLIGTLAKNFGAANEVEAAAYSGRGKSFFLTDLLKKVVFGEAGWVSTNRMAVRRATIMTMAAYGALGLVFVVTMSLWTISYFRNRDLIGATNRDVIDYRTIAAPVLRETVIAERNLGKVQPLLQKLRHLPTGYAVRNESTPIPATFGLSQRERLQSASETSYGVALERMFRSRLIFRMEELIEARMGEPSFIYEALKVYLMIGGRAKVDRDLVMSWMRRDWADNLYPGAANARGRAALEEHLGAVLDLEDGREPLISLNGPLVEQAQKTLARLSVAERAYQLLKSQASAASHKDFVVAFRTGQDGKLVFDVSGGGDLEDVRIPYFFTYDGFHSAFIDRLADIGEQVEGERWVLGSAGQQSAVVAQYATLFQDLIKLYTNEFTAAWNQMLGRLRLRPLNADKPRYVALSAASAATSPIKQLLESIRAETQLTKERPATKQAGQGGGTAGAVVGSAAVEAAERRANSALPSAISRPATTLGRMAIERQMAGASPDRFGSVSSEAPGANIEAQFRQFYVPLEGEGAHRPIDALLRTLSDINTNLQIAATRPAEAAAANATLVQHLATLRATASRFPPPFDAMIRQAVGDFEADATGTTVSAVQQALGDQVTRVCQQIVTNRYPFERRSERELPLADFARLFAPGGIIDRFFKDYVEQYVDRSKQPWAWRLDSRVARAFSPGTLREFQRAAEIRDAFFPTGGNTPSFTMSVTPLTLSGDASTAKFEINGTPVSSQQGVNAPVNVQWPGGGIGRTAITVTVGGGGGGFFGGGFFSPQAIMLERQGTWSFFRVLDAGSLLKQGDAVVATFAIGGREVSYQFNVGSLANPLVLQALREFRCPSGI